jgi:hypothetical protein
MQLVARKRISVKLKLGGLGIPLPNETIKGFQQNLIQKLHKARSQYMARLQSIYVNIRSMDLVDVQRGNRQTNAMEIV